MITIMKAYGAARTSVEANALLLAEQNATGRQGTQLTTVDERLEPTQSSPWERFSCIKVHERDKDMAKRKSDTKPVPRSEDE